MTWRRLLAQTALTARFQPGKPALGHRWELLDADGTEIARTRTVYRSGLAGRALGRLVTATGFAAGNNITVDLVGADGTAIARLASIAKDKRVDVTGPDGAPAGRARRVKGEGLYLEQPDGRPAGRVPIPEDVNAPWALLDASGATIGAVLLTPAKRVAPMSMAGLRT